MFYTFQVQQTNALVFINYAIVARKYDHEPWEAGEFCIRVVAFNENTNSWETEPINDSLWYKVSAPHLDQNAPAPAPWIDGLPGPDYGGYNCNYVYKPWTKVAISLSSHIYSTVRIEMYTSDCNWNVDPMMAYICGDYQPMILTPSGCPDPESDVVDTLTAPEGMLSYSWFVSTRRCIDDGDLTRASYMDTVPFRQVWPPEGGTDTLRTYTARLEDFILAEGDHAGDTVSRMTFMCKMTSALDPRKPFESRIYTNLTNRRPIVGSVHECHCDTSITFTDGSIVLVNDGLAHDSTHWVFYADTLGEEVLGDTVWGTTVTKQFPAPGYYGVKHFATTDLEPCTAAEFLVVRACGLPPADFTLSADEICESDVLQLHASDTVRNIEGLTLEWALDDSVLAATTADVNLQVPIGDHRLTLTVTNADGCSSTTHDSITVYGQPHIDLSTTVAAICEGDSVTLSAAGSIEYSWNAAPYDPTLDSAQGLTTFTVHPTVSTTYYLLPSEDNPCSVEGAQVYIEVLPYPVATIYTSSERVNTENGTLVVQDVSPYGGASSHWAFSDGTTAEGNMVSHAFADLSGDSVSISLLSCNRLNCCDSTTTTLPIQTTAVWFPNTFTPDEPVNNRFGMHTVLTLISYEMWIYNRQGQLVHYSNDPADQWDGTIDGGGKAPQGTYAWFCRYAYSHDATQATRGSVTLIR